RITLFYFFIFSFCFFTFSTLVSYGLLWSLSLFGLCLIYFKNASTDISAFSEVFSLLDPFSLLGSFYLVLSSYVLRIY
ncbi:uncharacterized protein B0P05DRAFT_567491, partial [Gilbertella persicaria]|uniref:uncharacterized protein n=1 Tax=Gilbertella persicaria TaxID=101096 RepID=UPI00221FE9EE